MVNAKETAVEVPGFDPFTRQIATANYHFPAGWYDDPWRPQGNVTQKRFWSGRHWSAKIRQN